MRKVFLWLLILLPINGLATSYTEYGPYQYSKEEIKESDLIEVTKEKYYKFYFNKKEYSTSYYKEGENDKRYPYQSKKHLLSNFSNYSLEKPEDKKNRIIEQKEIITYQKLKPIRYIKLDNLTADYTYFVIPDIKIYIDKVMIDYDVTVYPVNKKPAKIGYFKKNGYVLVDLKNNYDLDQIKLIIEGDSPAQVQFKYDISMHYDMSFNSDYVKSRRSILFDLGCFKNDTLIVDESMIINKEYMDIELDSIKDVNSFIIKSNSQTYYRYQDKLFRYYRVNKIYLNGYFDSVRGYIKDSKKTLTRYKYRVREYLEDIKKNSLEKEEINLQNDYPRHMGTGIIFSSLIISGYFIYRLIKKRGE